MARDKDKKMDYKSFIENKHFKIESSGFGASEMALHLRDYQRECVKWSCEEILILKAEIEFSRYGASKRAALVLNRDPSQVKAKMDQLSRMNRKSRDDIYARFGK